MKKFNWISREYIEDESFITRQDGVSLLDGNSKTPFKDGSTELTSHRLIWFDPRDSSYRIGVTLNNLKNHRLEKGSFGKPNVISIFILVDEPVSNNLNAPSNPVTNSSLDFVKLVFKKSGDSDFSISLNETLKAKLWEVTKNYGPRSKGILGIERNMEDKMKSTDKNISLAFADLNKLMSKAKEMVTLCNSISQKIMEKSQQSSGEINEDDETRQFKSYLLSMGISNPVTRDQYSDTSSYSNQLAKELNGFLEPLLPKFNGVMSASEVFCRWNRARGMELVSTEDLVQAGRCMGKLKLPVLLKIFDSGVMIFQLASLSDEKSMTETVELIKNHGGAITADRLSRILILPTMLCKERLLLCENKGLLCRDDSVEGLSFYENKF